ncbi:MAG: hypothetical protein RL380_659 [Verrucomicrobiota bacterium]|jgi:hypothetical protein
MKTLLLATGLAVSAITATAAERAFNFSDGGTGKLPADCRSVSVGRSELGAWTVIQDDAPSQFAALTPNAHATSRHAVLAQTAGRPEDGFAMLVFDGESYGDFTLTTSFKIMGGTNAQSAGVAFRVQDEKNFYVLGADALAGTLTFAKFTDGKAGKPIGGKLPVAQGVWHELKVKCKANEISIWLDGKDFPALNDNAFAAGKIALWTRADTTANFSSTKVEFTPREPHAQAVVNELMNVYPRLRGLRIYAPKDAEGSEMKIVASNFAEDVGLTGSEFHQQAFKLEKLYYSKGKENVVLVQPLRDRNGDPIGAVELTMESFLGQMEQSALARALPIMKALHQRIQLAKDLVP